MNKINFLKPEKDNFSLYVSLGLFFLALSFLDATIDFTSVLPSYIGFFMPLFFGYLGFHFIRIEKTGNKLIDLINKKVNLSPFNSILTLTHLLKGCYER